MCAIIFGCGFLGLEIAKELLERGVQVAAVRRSKDSLAELERLGIKGIQADITNPADIAKISPTYDWVINTAASGGGGVEEYRRLYLEGNRNLITWLQNSPPKKFVYTSSTSVYGQNDGSAVDESSPTVPDSETSRLLLETEKLLLNRNKIPIVILRLAGLYGAGRGFYLKQFLTGQARLTPETDRLANMIHAGDAARAVVSALEAAPAGAVYNVVDDEPVKISEIYKWLAEKTNRPLENGEAEGPRSGKRGLTNKAVSNKKIKADLKLQWLYPTFREGYSAELARLGL